MTGKESFKRLFLGSPLSGELQEESERVVKAQRSLPDLARIRWVSTDNRHLTWYFFGNTPDTDIPALCQLLNDTLSKQKPVTLAFDELACWPQPGGVALVWQSRQTEGPAFALQAAILQALAISGDKRWLPHITLARLKTKKPRQKITPARFTEYHPPQKYWTVGSICLYESTLTPQGPIYTCLQEWALK